MEEAKSAGRANTQRSSNHPTFRHEQLFSFERNGQIIDNGPKLEKPLSQPI